MLPAAFGAKAFDFHFIIEGQFIDINPFGFIHG
jgi:hypothetical protein